VQKTAGPLLVLAGAGTGKTRVVTCRIAHLIASGVGPRNILAVTFTKKAAKEMRDRVAELLDGRSNGITVCTFHSLGYRLLCENEIRVGADGHVNVLTSREQRDLVRDVLESVDLKGWFDITGALRSISRAKNGITTDSSPMSNENGATLARIVAEYQRVMEERQAVDFDDLLLIPLRMLRESRRLRELYRRRWPFILIDEYQDTNDIQHALVQLLIGEEQNICVVGDDDQSIYGFRGAMAERILGFENEFPGATLITLDQSYRSHKEILDLANLVIDGASVRHQKSLQSLRGDGGIVVRKQAVDAQEESVAIADAIQQRKLCPGVRWSDIAVLFRVQSDARILKETLKARDIPHQSAVTNGDSADSVSIMTLHRSKGLEFPTVFLPAIEEDTIPHFHAVRNGRSGIEEERRLLYVGVTRAQRELVLSSCLRRRGRPRRVSRFLTEIGLG
jgi:superfamily I DNA/RNA helicase